MLTNTAHRMQGQTLYSMTTDTFNEKQIFKTINQPVSLYNTNKHKQV